MSSPKLVFSPSLSTMEWYYPSNMTDCMDNIDSGFGTLQAKQGACQAFLTNTFPDALDSMAMMAQAANQVKYASWCRAKANAIRSGTGIEEPDYSLPEDMNDCISRSDSSITGSSIDKEIACQFLLNENTTADALRLAAKSAESSSPIYASWCRQMADIRSGGNGGEHVIDPPDEPPFPKDMSECVMNIDSSMPSDQRQDACKELFNPGNSSEIMLAFSKDAEDAGYPIAAGWFKHASEMDVSDAKVHFEKYKNYYIAGGISLAFLLVLIAGISLGKD